MKKFVYKKAASLAVATAFGISQLMPAASVFAVGSNADFSINPSAAAIAAGDDVTVTVSLDYIPAGVTLSGAQISLGYNSDVFTLKSVKKGQANSTSQNYSVQPYVINNDSWADMESGYSTLGEYASLVFTANTDAAAGDYEFTFTKANVWDFDAKKMGVDFAPAKVSIATMSSETKPTVTADGKAAEVTGDAATGYNVNYKVPYSDKDTPVTFVVTKPDKSTMSSTTNTVQLTPANKESASFEITAENGAKATTTISVDYEAASTDATLKTVKIGGVAVTAGTDGTYTRVVPFSKALKDDPGTYELEVEPNHIKATVDMCAPLSPKGIGENEGASGIVTVTAEDGTTKKDYTLKVYIEECDHINGTPVRENEVQGSCTVDTTYDEVIYCEICGDELSRTPKTIKSQGHIKGTPVRENEVAANCTEAGSYDEVVYCTECQAEISREKKTIPPLGHVYTGQPFIADDEKGHYQECVHDSSHHSETVPHTFDAGRITTQPTYTTDGFRTYTCTVCGYEKTENIGKTGELIAHEAKAPTCLEAGNSSYWEDAANGLYFADAAGTVPTTLQAVTIPATGHSFTNYISDDDATCETNGHETAKCDHCDATDTREVLGSAKGHDYAEVGRIPADCLNDGRIDYECRHDPSHTYSEVIDALGHTPGTIQIENSKDATCTEAGGYDEAVYCTECKTELSRVHVTVPALGHDWGKWSVAKPASCSEEGEETRTCQRDKTTTETRVIPKLPHSFDKAVDNGDGTHTKTCTECKEEVTEPHNYNAVSYTPPTSTQPGRRFEVCADCGNEREVIIPPTGENGSSGYTPSYTPYIPPASDGGSAPAAAAPTAGTSNYTLTDSTPSGMSVRYRGNDDIDITVSVPADKAAKKASELGDDEAAILVDVLAEGKSGAAEKLDDPVIINVSLPVSIDPSKVKAVYPDGSAADVSVTKVGSDSSKLRINAVKTGTVSVVIGGLSEAEARKVADVDGVVTKGYTSEDVSAGNSLLAVPHSAKAPVSMAVFAGISALAADALTVVRRKRK
ncbi:MAG: hypothetical protein J6F31_08455 [Oscillospiraceae bacterium]|nr:hypothetical protein [Oscillospiraceae bacterium]